MYEALMPSLVAIVKAASAVILEVYHSTDFQIQKKGDDSPLTIADQKANEVIMKGLQALELQFPIISEENKLVSYVERAKYDQYWLVDPLDGTKEFIKRNGEFTVNIALIENNQPVMGIVGVPVQDRIFYGIKDQGAFLLENGTTQTLKANAFHLEDKGLKIVTSRSHLNEATRHYIDQLNAPEFVPMGSSLKFLIIAEGKADVYPRFGPCMEWDTGAAQIILEEAGGSVVQVDALDKPLVYNKENLLNPFFISFGKVIGARHFEA